MITSPVTRHVALQTACRAGALAMLVAFWFDGGLFKLATASVFWILLELGAERQKLKTESGRQFRHLTPALSPDEAEREPKSKIENANRQLNGASFRLHQITARYIPRLLQDETVSC